MTIMKYIWTPNYCVQKLYANHVGDHTLQLNVAGMKHSGKEGIYVTASETKEGKLILKAVNTTDDAFLLPVEGADGQPVAGAAKIWVLETAGEKPAEKPEPSKVAECALELNGSIRLAPKSFTVLEV
ncbi:MAG: hypothetical protein ACLTSZ_03645 [Lachnospiraceae bacterium]